MPDEVYKRESEMEVTKASAGLPGLDIDVVHRQSPNGDFEEVTINLRAIPSFEAFGRFIEVADPLTFWVRAAQLMWAPWLTTAQAMMMLPAGPLRTLPGTIRPQQQVPTAND
jgi:hypothetical protein